MHQRGFVVEWYGAVDTAFQYTEVRQQLAHLHRLLRRQRQVVRAPRVGRDGAFAGARVAAERVFKFKQLELFDAALDQMPRRREAGHAAADDGDVELAGFTRCGEVLRAQAVAERHRRAVDLGLKFALDAFTIRHAVFKIAGGEQRRAKRP